MESDAIEQYSRRNTLEIQGVPLFAPVELPEQTREIVMSVKALNIRVGLDMIQGRQDKLVLFCGQPK